MGYQTASNADAFSHTRIYVGGGQIVHLTGKFKQKSAHLLGG
ncbi:hypothetical protein [Helicobacter bizzozeronii]|nr:hypothetical protein [Helicobacter bizzozeronii]